MQSDATEPAPTEATPPSETFDFEAFQLSTRIASLMKARHGPSWSRQKPLQKLAERAMADLRGYGDGRALRALQATPDSNIQRCLASKFGLAEVPWQPW